MKRTYHWRLYGPGRVDWGVMETTVGSYNAVKRIRASVAKVHVGATLGRVKRGKAY